MTDRQNNDITTTELQAWIRTHPEAWLETNSELPVSDEWLADIADRVVSGRHVERRREQSRHRRGRRWIVVGGISVVALATAAFAVLRSEPASEPTVIACLATEDLQGDVVAIRASETPIEACAELWRNGTLGTGEVPELTACVNEGGAAAIFPSDRTICERLNLPALEPGVGDEQAAIVTLDETLQAVFADTCFEQDAAVVEAQRLLDQPGLDGWTVAVAEDFPAGSECAGTGILAQDKIILLLGVRPR